MGDPAAEEPPMKLKLGISKNKKAFSFRGLTPTSLDPAVGSAPDPKRSPSSKFATTPLTLGL